MRKVLVIDDHAPSRQHLIDILRQDRHEIAGEERSGERALALARATKPDVLLMAVGLADRDGIEAAGEILENCRVPIILFTSHYDAETVARATKVGVMALLLKPVRAEAVTPAIEMAISRFNDLAVLQRENESLKENLAGRKIIEQAKGVLMEQHRLTEAEAYALLKKTSMNQRKPMAEIARAVLLSAAIDVHKK